LTYLHEILIEVDRK